MPTIDHHDALKFKYLLSEPCHCVPSHLVGNHLLPRVLASAFAKAAVI
jgi:hypothetical protein